MLLIVNWADIQRHHEKNAVSMKGLISNVGYMRNYLLLILYFAVGLQIMTN